MGKVRRGITEITNIRRGNTSLSKIYRGQSLIWEPAAPGPSYVTANLLQYIDPFDSTIGGGTASDLSGNSNTATLVNSIAVTGTKGNTNAGWRLNVTGGSAKYLNLGLSGTNMNSGFTMEVWFKVITGSSYDSEPGMLYMYGVSPDRQFGIGNKASGEGFISYGQVQGSTGNLEIKPAGSVKDSTWHQWVLTYLPASGAVLYKDAVSKGTSASNVGDPTRSVVINAGGPIGTFIRGYADAYMGLTRLYNKVLTASEVTQNFNANKADYGL